MNSTLKTMMLLTGLKATRRSGWNVNFPPGHRYRLRRVKNAESVGSHSWGLVMLATLVTSQHDFDIDVGKILRMAAGHDTAELETEDILTAHLEGEELRLVEERKQLLEEAAMQRLFLEPGTKAGRECYDLWVDYKTKASPEAVLLKQLDKLEACLQAVCYHMAGEEVDSREFLDYADPFIKHPILREMLQDLREAVDPAEAIAAE